MKHIFIVNPCAGKADASAALVPRLIEQLALLGIDYTIEMTDRPRHATEITKQYAMTRDPVRFYACGGDGTLNEVVAGAYQYPLAEVACVPLGSGNDLVRNFGEKEDFLDIPDLVAGRAIPIDLMSVNGQVGVAICSVGLDADVASGMPRFRRMPLVNGSMAYNLSIAQNICRPLGKVMSVSVDGETFVGKFLVAAIANGSYYGGGVCAAPTARLDDGLLDVLLVKKISRLKIAGVLGRYMHGTHFFGGQVTEDLAQVITYRRAKTVTIQPEMPLVTNVDGECTLQPALEVSCLPAAARFVLPAKLAATYIPARAEDAAVAGVAL